MLLCQSPVFLSKLGHYVDCGHCLACRQKRRSTWASRISHEISTRKHQAIFVTLTYDDDHLPENGTLMKRHLQLLHKLMRKHIEIPFKYYACGEYGPKTCRPHYHAIYMGLTTEYRDLIFRLWGRCKRAAYRCSACTGRKAASYVAGYVNKKLGKRYDPEFLYSTGRFPEFQLCSSGIGADYARQNILGAYLYVNGKKTVPPRYYRKILQLDAANYTDYIEQKNRDTLRQLQDENPHDQRLFWCDVVALTTLSWVVQYYLTFKRAACRDMIVSWIKGERGKVEVLQ